MATKYRRLTQATLVFVLAGGIASYEITEHRNNQPPPPVCVAADTAPGATPPPGVNCPAPSTVASTGSTFPTPPPASMAAPLDQGYESHGWVVVPRSIREAPLADGGTFSFITLRNDTSRSQDPVFLLVIYGHGKWLADFQSLSGINVAPGHTGTFQTFWSFGADSLESGTIRQVRDATYAFVDYPNQEIP
jgi:hypothetical protein